MLVRLVLGTLLSPGPCQHSGLGNSSVALVMSSPSWSCLMSCITSLATHACCRSAPCCNSCPGFVELSVVFESLGVIVHHLGVQGLVYTFLKLTLLLLLTLQFFGIADVLSMHLFNLLSAHTHLDKTLPRHAYVHLFQQQFLKRSG